MSTSNFDISIKSDVSDIAARASITQSQAMAFWLTKRLLDISDEELIEAVSLDGANDKGIDLFYVDNENSRVIIGQAKYAESLDVNVRDAHLNALQASLNWLSQPETLLREGRPDLATAADDYVRCLKDGFSTELWFIYTASTKISIQRAIDVYNKNPDNVENSKAIRHFALEQIRTEWSEYSQQMGNQIAKDTLRLAAPATLPFAGTFGQAVIVCLPASELKRLYEKHRDALFDRNVRLFLGNRRGSVNAAIAQTIGDSEAQGNFWAYNNGITMICDDFSEANGSVTIQNFNIITDVRQRYL